MEIREHARAGLMKFKNKYRDASVLPTTGGVLKHLPRYVEALRATKSGLLFAPQGFRRS